MAPPSRHEFPAELYDFARSLKGGYAERFDAILDRAFTSHEGLLLTGHGLRSIAGGGTNPVAQDALDRFRKRLHKSIGARVAHASDLPEALAARYGAVIGEMWADARKVAHQEFSDERTRMADLARTTSEQLESETKARVLAETNQRALQAKLDLAMFDVAEGRSRLTATIADLQATAARAQAAEAALAAAESLLESRKQSFEAEIEAARSAAAELESRHAASVKAHREEIASLAGEHRAERESIRHDHLLALDNQRQEARRREADLVHQLQQSQQLVSKMAEEHAGARAAHQGAMAGLQARLDAAQEHVTRLEVRNEQLSLNNGVLTADRDAQAERVRQLLALVDAAASASTASTAAPAAVPPTEPN